MKSNDHQFIINDEHHYNEMVKIAKYSGFSWVEFFNNLPERTEHLMATFEAFGDALEFFKKLKQNSNVLVFKIYDGSGVLRGSSTDRKRSLV